MTDTKWRDRFLDLAKHISTWSKDPSRQIGAVAIEPSTKRILSTGYNGFPRGIDDSDNRLTDRETKYKYVVHGEMNAIYNATMNGVNLSGSDFYVYGLPVCSECAKGLIQVGVKRVFILVDQEIPDTWAASWAMSQSMLNEAGISTEIVYKGK